ncbi:PEP-utilizing enzyme [Nocardia sp. NPDC059239]|uniref:PEP-utilizing enzyme n=1 Tax=unclassified Nocardia TaxID=2637762 RepID=UPI003697EA85
MTNPLHEIGSPETAWTTVNTRENFPGVATPLGWTFWRDPLELGMKGAFCDLGVLPRRAVTVPESVDDRFSAAVFGRFAANIDCLRRAADLMPGTSGDALEEQLLGSVRPGVESHPSMRRYPIIAGKMGWTVLRLPARIRRLRADTDRWWRTVTAPGGIPDPAAARKVLLEAAQRFEDVMCPHSIVTLLGTGIFDQISEIATASGNSSLSTSLITGFGDVEEAKSAGQLWEVSRGERSLSEFVADHGYHGPVEAEISSRSWREDPTPLQRLVTTYRGLPESSSPLARAERQREERATAERSVFAGLGALDRRKARMVLNIARRYIPLREVGKAAFVQTVDAARAAARVIGADLVTRGLLRSAADMYYLTFDEITGELPVDCLARVDERRAIYNEFVALELPDQWVGVPVAQPSRAAEPEDVTEVRGMPVSVGTVEGIARVVHDADAGDLEDGEILVCATTDPSWASCFLVAGAVVIDIGGPLSHGAIVAREMGIPCVINTGNGTRAIKTGDRLLVDGSTGLVQIRERAAENAVQEVG